jgi:hypothetical protein
MKGGMRGRRPARPPDALAADKRFGKYKKEEEKAVRKPDAEESETLKRLREAWEECRTKFRGISQHHAAKYAMKTECLPVVSRISCTPEDLEKFSLLLGDLQGQENFRQHAGVFLSALVMHLSRCRRDDSYIIHTAHLDPVDFIGIQNAAMLRVVGSVGEDLGGEMALGRITIEGNTGHKVGYQLHGGEIVVMGDVESYVGQQMWKGRIHVHGNVLFEIGTEMGNGEIIIEKDVFANVGHSMRGGTITIKGNAGMDVGNGMRNGVIHLEGDFKNIGTVKGGKIYHKGKLIVDK